MPPPAVTLFAMQDGVPLAPAPTGSARGTAAGVGRVACCWRPGGAIKAKALATAHLGRRPGGEQFGLEDLNQQDVDRREFLKQWAAKKLGVPYGFFRKAHLFGPWLLDALAKDSRAE
jgi:hypothetical protein